MFNIERSLDSIGGLNLLSNQDTIIHRLDPRTKTLVALLLIIITVSFNKYRISSILPLALYPVVMMSLGGIPFRSIAYKVIAVSPFAIAVGIVNPFIDRNIVMSVGGIGISGGTVSFISIIIKFILTVSSALILVASTGFERICTGLIKLHVPKAFVVQLLFMFRYLFVLFDEALRMMRAHCLRASKPYPDIRILGSFIGSLLLRSFDRVERIHRAMLVRGFDGELRTIGTLKMNLADYAFIVFWSFYFISCRLMDLPEIIGSMMMSIAA